MNSILTFISVIFLSSAAPAESPFQVATKNTFKETIASRMMTLEQWNQKIDEEGFDLICLGETHDDYFRKFESTKVVPFISANQLLVEERNETASSYSTATQAQTLGEFKVTGADFTSVAQAYFEKNKSGKIIGIEVSKEQKGAITLAELSQIQGNVTLTQPSRDSFIAENADKALQSTDRSIAIYGSNHCTYLSRALGFDTPFIRQLRDQYESSKKIINVHIVKKDEAALLKIYLQEFEIFPQQEDMVLFDAASIDPAVYNYRMELFTLLQSYDVLIFPVNFK